MRKDIKALLLDEPDFLKSCIQGSLQEILEAEIAEALGVGKSFLQDLKIPCHEKSILLTCTAILSKSNSRLYVSLADIYTAFHD